MKAYERITKEQIEDMQYQIGIHADKKEAKRFSKLSFATAQKVTYILRERERKARRVDMHIDIFLVREVINDAQSNVFLTPDTIDDDKTHVYTK